MSLQISSYLNIFLLRMKEDPRKEDEESKKTESFQGFAVFQHFQKICSQCHAPLVSPHQWRKDSENIAEQYRAHSRLKTKILIAGKYHTYGNLQYMCSNLEFCQIETDSFHKVFKPELTNLLSMVSKRQKIRMIRYNIRHILSINMDQPEILKRQRLKVWHITSGSSTDLAIQCENLLQCTQLFYTSYIYITYIPGFMFMKVQCFDPLSATAMGVSLQKTGVASFI